MLTNHLLEEINRVWEQQDDEDSDFLSEVVVCQEIGEILKKENFYDNISSSEWDSCPFIYSRKSFSRVWCTSCIFCPEFKTYFNL